MKKRRGILSVIWDAVFPQYCISCSKEGEPICLLCIKKIPLDGVFLCPYCKQFSEKGKNCCQKQGLISSHMSISHHEQDVLTKILKEYKYGFIRTFEPYIFSLVQAFIQAHALYFDIDCVVPIPLHKRKEAERGFNQSFVLAKAIAELRNIACVDILKRSVYTKQQATLTHQERIENLEHVFKKRTDVQYKKILLVDDVYTTGSTIQACAQALGVKEVQSFSLLRSKIKP